MHPWNIPHRSVALVVTCWLFVVPAGAYEIVSFHQKNADHRVEGRALVKAVDGGVLLQGRDGSIWAIQSSEIVEWESNDEAFRAYSREQLAQLLRQQLPAGFDVFETNNYLVAYNTSRVYAQWCAALFERLHRAFQNFWRKRGVPLRDPEFPLVAVIFERRDEYEAFSRDEVGDAIAGIVGYYSLQTNRITMYDLTGLEAGRNGRRPRTADLINRVLSQPTAEPNVATIVHEATHQLAYNTGLQTSFASNPLWLSEGLAVYFETPDLRSAKGWRGIGNINYRRLERFRDFANRRPPDSLRSLIAADVRFRNSEQAVDAYAEAWGLCYFLLKRKQKDFVNYVQALSQQKPFSKVTAEERLAIFQRHFGDLKTLDAEFVAYLTRLR